VRSATVPRAKARYGQLTTRCDEKVGDERQDRELNLKHSVFALQPVPVMTARVAKRITELDADLLLVQGAEDQTALEDFHGHCCSGGWH
jgi:hypothetical protein